MTEESNCSCEHLYPRLCAGFAHFSACGYFARLTYALAVVRLLNYPTAAIKCTNSLSERKLICALALRIFSACGYFARLTRFECVPVEIKDFHVAMVRFPLCPSDLLVCRHELHTPLPSKRSLDLRRLLAFQVKKRRGETSPNDLKIT